MVSHVKLVVSCGCYRDPSIVPSPSNRCIALVERFCPHVARGRFLFARLDIGLATRMLAVAGIDHRILCICQEADEAMDVRTSAQRKALQYCILFGTQHPNSPKNCSATAPRMPRCSPKLYIMELAFRSPCYSRSCKTRCKAPHWEGPDPHSEVGSAWTRATK